MKFIGIMGGVGCGKSAVIKELSKRYNCICYEADEVAKKLRAPGTECFQEIVESFNRENVFIRDKSGEILDIDSAKMAELVFSHHDKLFLLNSIIHPAVKRYILSQVEAERNLNKVDYFFFEAALIIEEGYDKLCDEVWYIRADESVRRQRLIENRDYSDSKINEIMNSQLSDEEFISKATYVIDNSKDINETMNRIEDILTNID